MSRRVTRTDLAAQIHACCEVMGERGTRILAMLAVWQWQGAPEEGEVGEFCEAAAAWHRRMFRERAGIPGLSQSWYALRLDMGKSNLMARVLYGGEDIRTTPCPHNKTGHECLHLGCPVCGGCGWLPNATACEGGIEWVLGTPLSEYADTLTPECDPIDAACEIPDLEVMRPIPERPVDRAKSLMCFGVTCEESP